MDTKRLITATFQSQSAGKLSHHYVECEDFLLIQCGSSGAIMGSNLGRLAKGQSEVGQKRREKQHKMLGQ